MIWGKIIKVNGSKKELLRKISQARKGNNIVVFYFNTKNTINAERIDGSKERIRLCEVTLDLKDARKVLKGQGKVETIAWAGIDDKGRKVRSDHQYHQVTIDDKILYAAFAVQFWRINVPF